MELEQILINVMCTVAGLAFHVIKKASVEKVDPIEYIRIHKGRSSAALSAIAVGFGTLMTASPDASMIEFFAVGYMGDSVFNKSPTQEEVDGERKKRELKKLLNKGE